MTQHGEEIRPGMTNTLTRTVEEHHLASQWGSGLAPVLATPALVAFCEECARLTVDPLLPAGQQTVGSEIHLQHLAATPLGMQVSIRTELVKVDGRRLCFRIVAHDEADQVGKGEHERFIIDVERFEQRLASKAQRVDASH